MIVTRAAAILGAAMTLTAFVPATARAQQPVAAFGELDTRLKPGDTVWITDAQGRDTKGRIRELTTAAIVLDGREPRTFAADTVRAVRERAGSRVGRSTLWGTAIGAALGVTATMLSRETATTSACGFPPAGCEPEVIHQTDWLPLPLLTGMGAGVGAVVGALLPARTRDVYRATPAPAGARLQVAPFLLPHARGVRVAVTF